MTSRIYSRFKSWWDAYPFSKGVWAQKALVLALYTWVAIFILTPLAIILKISFAESITAIPPYSALTTWTDETFLNIRLNLSNYIMLVEDWLYISAYLRSVFLATIATFFCFLLGYPMAYGIARARESWRTVLLMLVILPFWTSFLIRIYAWIGLLSTHGTINTVLLKLGFIHDPLPLLNNDFAVCLGLVYCYLPFMILPLYSTLEKMDRQLLEAAFDLGCKPFKGFLKITLPLSMPGIIAGSMLVFIPCVGEFVIPELLGGTSSLTIGRLLWNEFFNSADWPAASAVAIALLILVVTPMVILQRFQMRGIGR